METINDNVSYFNYPIGNTTPEKTMSLHAVSKIVMLGELIQATNKVRAGIWSKTKKLPYITPSGCFYTRCDTDIVSYSGIVSIDLDDINGDCTDAACHVSTLKHILFEDHFLNPAFIFVSPSKRGLKIFIRIRGAEASFHKDYFRVISAYLKEQYRVKADSSCRNLSRACLLCHDPEALFSLFGCVAHTDLLCKLPPKPPSIVPLLSSLYAHFNYTPYYGKHLSDKLNACPAVHAHALIYLRKCGWVQKGNSIYFTRPGKTNSTAVSATFRLSDKYGIYIFYNFSSNAPPFQAGKGYNDCQVIALLQYNSDYGKCISALADKYDSLLGA